MPKSVLVLGGGTTGNALAVLLARAGIDVELVESKQDWNATSGSGITVQGNALRVLREVGVLDGVLASGWAFDGLALRSPAGELLAEPADVRTGGDDLPATVGMQRPQLQRLLIDAVRDAGVPVRLGTRATAVHPDGAVEFSDGETGRYDLVVVAEGLGSATRAMLGITDRAEPVGMGIWRAPAPRPEGLERTEIAYGGPCYIAGICPTGPETVYCYLVERNRDRATLDPDRYAEEMRELAAGYGGAWPQIRASLTDPAQVNYTWFDRLLVEGPWHRGRAVLAGDAAHCCPPTLAQGAAMSLEDAAVLAELLTGSGTWDEALLTEYRRRREPRVRAVVDASVQITRWLLDGDPDADVPGLMDKTMKTLAKRP